MELSIPYHVLAQDISAGEYFFNADPGLGNGQSLSFTQTSELEQTFERNVTSLPIGFNMLGIRFQDVNGLWSTNECRVFYILPEPETLPGGSNKLVYYEYYFDADPGVGNGTGSSISLTDSVSEILEIPVTGLEPGFHIFSIRYKDYTDRWSPMESNMFYIFPEPLPGGSNKLVYYEYYFDVDPGVGNGTGASISQTDSITEILEIPFTGLEPGFHTFSIRYKDISGLWSPMESRVFYITPEPETLPGGSNKLVQYEYYFDEDPGIGQGTGAYISQADSVNEVFEITIAGLEPGFHIFSIRYQDFTGRWSPMESRVFYVLSTPVSPEGKPDIIAMEYYVGDDPGLGNGVPVSLNVSPDTVLQDTVLIDITGLGLPEGDYILSIRCQDDLGNWSLMESRPFTYCVTAATYYADADGDSFGDLLEESLACSQPDGYVSNPDDCDDDDEFVNIEVVTWYYDGDNDGYGTPDSSIASCPHPDHFLLNSDDCNDSDSLINPFTKWYPDNDHDGYSAGATFVLSCMQPVPGYVLETGDCDDMDSTLNPLTVWYYDGDEDDLGDPDISTTSCTQPGSNYVRNGDDCYDGDALIGAATPWYRDWDQDGFGNPDSVKYSCTMPAGYVFNADDCDDTDGNIGSDAINWYIDKDHDGYGDTSDTIFTCLAPPGYVSNKDDCNDTDSLVNPLTVWYRDADEDGFGDTDDTLIICMQPAGYVMNADDCDDSDDRVNIEDINWYYDGDNDGYGNPDSIFMFCPQPDGYVYNSDDCNDNDSLLNPLTKWYIDEDKDGYGDESTYTLSCEQPAADYILTGGDCNDADSALNPLTVWYADNDADGFGDPEDYAIVCVKPSDNYVLNDDDCDDSDKTVGIPGMWYQDADQDGLGNADSVVMACSQPTGYVANYNDCNDDDIGILDGITWYVDNDNDGYGNPADTLYACVKPGGYTDNNDDCNDTDSLINPQTIWYLDADQDGFGDFEYALVTCIQPEGYVDNGDDCNDNDNEVSGADRTWYADVDQDSYGSMVDSLVSCDRLDGYVSNNEDCNDSDNLLTPYTVWYLDADGDGFGIPEDSIITCTQPANYVLNMDDCNDEDYLINPGTSWFFDSDQDGFGNKEDTIISCIQPDGYVLDNSDCNDQDNEVSGNEQTWYADIDKDSYGSMVDSLVSCDRPDGYVLNNEDCNDANNILTPFTVWYLDADGDGFGIPDDSLITCEQPKNYVLNTDDCDDTNGMINPETIWYRDSDGDHYGDLLDSLVACHQPDGYILEKGDCNDNDPDMYPGGTALPDGKDNDCDGSIDLASQSINYTPPVNIQDTTAFEDLDITASSGLPLSMEIYGPAHLESGKLIPDGPGKVTIKAWQPGNEYYLPSDTIEYDFCVDPVPRISVEIGIYTILLSNYSSGNQWYFSGNQITNANDSLYVVLQSGLYSLEVDKDGCNAFSEQTNVTVSGNVGEDPLRISVNCPNRICLNQSDSLIIKVTGGIPPYQLTFRHRKFQSPEFQVISRLLFPEDQLGILVDDTSMDEIGMAYDAFVKDSKGEEEFLDETFIGWYFTDEEEVKLPLDAFGGTLHDYRIFSIPYILEDNLISSIFEPTFGAYDKTRWRLVHYRNNVDASAGYVDYQAGINRIETGKGYWINAITPQEIKLSNGEINMASPYILKLEKGWNQIGNPYNIPIYWNTILANNDAIDLVSELFVYEPSVPAFVSGNQVEPFKGGFVWANDKMNVTISPINQLQGERIASGRINVSNIDNDRWLIPIHLDLNGTDIHIGGIGMHPESCEFKDAFDIMAIPRFNSYIDMYSKHPGYFYPWFSTDVVPTQNEYIWAFRLESNFVRGTVLLGWNNSMMSDCESQLYLIDNTTGSHVNMKEQDHYTLDLQDSYPITIYYFKENGNDLIPGVILLGNAYPNPTGKEVTIPILLSSEMMEYKISLSVFDMNGREVASLVSGTYPPGMYEINWDLKNETGQLVKSGVYLYQLSFEDEIYPPQQKRIIIQP